MKTAFTGASLLAALASCAHGQLTFEFTKSSGFMDLETADPAKAAAMYASAVSAGAKWSSLFGNPVTLKYTLDYDPGSLPSGVLAAAISTYTTSHKYTAVKDALVLGATSPHDMVSSGALPGTPFVPMLRNDVYDSISPGFEIMFDGDASTNNTFFDLSHSNAKALGLISGSSGGAGSDATIKIGGATFDFDPSDGISSGSFDFKGVMLHEIAHAMGFVSGVDTMSSLFPPPFSPPPTDPDTVAMLTVLDLFRFSHLSAAMGVRDLSLPLPGSLDPVDKRFFSLTGAVPLEYFSTGFYPFAPFGDGAQAGHWKTDATFGLMDPTLAPGFALTSSWEALFGSGLPTDVIALDVIGWTMVPSPSTFAATPLLLLAVPRKRRA